MRYVLAPHKIDVRVQHRDGTWALLRACRDGYERTVVVVPMGVPVNHHGSTQLWYADDVVARVVLP